MREVKLDELWIRRDISTPDGSIEEHVWNLVASLMYEPAGRQVWHQVNNPVWDQLDEVQDGD